MSPDLRQRRVVIEGPIGAGKTSLALRLAGHLGARLLLERPEANPFLERFYRDPERWALATQLAFLFDRLRQLEDLQAQIAAGPPAGCVADFLLLKDPLFARLTLPPDQLPLYEQVWARMRRPELAPDLVIYLQAAPEVLAARVARRAIPMEAAIGTPYLRGLSEQYARFFHQYDEAPVLTVNTEHLNAAERDADFALLLERIGAMRGRREHFGYEG